MDAPRSATLAPIVLDTLEACLRYHHGLRVHCPRCRRWVDLDLGALVECGRGPRRVLGLRPRCQICGGPGFLQLRPPMPGWEGPGSRDARVGRRPAS